MTDTERLDLIEHYHWSIECIQDGWHIHGMFGLIEKYNCTLREAIDAALAAQAKWSIG